MSIAFAQTPACEAAYAEVCRAAAAVADAEDALTLAFPNLETHQRPESGAPNWPAYERVNQALAVLLAARRAYDQAEARWRWLLA